MWSESSSLSPRFHTALLYCPFPVSLCHSTFGVHSKRCSESPPELGSGSGAWQQ